MKTHLMLDLETLGKTPGCIVLSIAAITFTKDQMLKKFKVNLAIGPQKACGLEVDIETLKWWLMQRTDILKAQMSNAIPPVHALMDFNEFFRSEEPTLIWGNGAAFDAPVLKAVYKAFNIIEPWQYWQEMCVRTINNLFDGRPAKDSTRAHDPLYDCEYQINCLWNQSAIRACLE